MKHECVRNEKNKNASITENKWHAVLSGGATLMPLITLFIENAFFHIY